MTKNGALVLIVLSSIASVLCLYYVLTTFYLELYPLTAVNFVLACANLFFLFMNVRNYRRLKQSSPSVESKW